MQIKFIIKVYFLPQISYTFSFNFISLYLTFQQYFRLIFQHFFSFSKYSIYLSISYTFLYSPICHSQSLVSLEICNVFVCYTNYVNNLATHLILCQLVLLLPRMTHSCVQQFIRPKACCSLP